MRMTLVSFSRGIILLQILAVRTRLVRIGATTTRTISNLETILVPRIRSGKRTRRTQTLQTAPAQIILLGPDLQRGDLDMEALHLVLKIANLKLRLCAAGRSIRAIYGTEITPIRRSGFIFGGYSQSLR